MKREIAFKSFSFKAEDVSEDGMIRGFASTFGNVDYGLDVVDKGAFAKSIKESKGLWPILADHDPSKQIGWNMRAQETDVGLLVEGSLDLNVQAAREKHSLIKGALARGAKMGLSIGYTTIKQEPDRTNPQIRHLKELKLWEYSVVTFPMNAEASVTAAKSQNLKDRMNFLFEQGKELGLSKDEIKEALFETAGQDFSGLIASLENTNQLFTKAAPTFDPAQLCQSIEATISLFKKAN